eukprot:scaffold32731_cov65-Phaeocystis_antarctica.AAC.2
MAGRHVSRGATVQRVEGDEKEVATALRTFHMVRSTTPYIWYAHKVARCQYNSPTPDTARFLSVLQVVRHGDGPRKGPRPIYQRVLMLQVVSPLVDGP